MAIDFNEMEIALSKLSKRTKVGLAIGLAAVNIGLAGLLSYNMVKGYNERERRENPNFPQLDITRNLNEVQRPDGRVERIIKTQEGREYVLRDCLSVFNPRPKDIDGPYNSKDIEVVCTYDLGGERSYMGALEYADKIYQEEQKLNESGKYE